MSTPASTPQDPQPVDPQLADPQPVRTFHWEACREELNALAQGTKCGILELDEKRRSFRSEHLSVTPPLIFPITEDCNSLTEYLDQLPEEPERQLVILMQAGAVSLGLFEAGEVVVTKSDKKYVVRGNGRAQPSYLKTRGKSRYGSRLRLQNAQRLLVQTNETLNDWHEDPGPADQVFYNAPVRLWPALFETKPEPPFEREETVRIPLDTPRPTTDVLLRTYRSMSYGRIEHLASEG